MSESLKDEEFEKKQTTPTDPVLRLIAVLRGHYLHPQFQQAVKDLEMLDLARYFPESVAEKTEITERLKKFLESLPEDSSKTMENFNKLVKLIEK
ncbi:hypothetical protein JW911_00065 [Candidatus Peregrinibacteria bacterium]|nr:hypothetical protein [Candidatus Peregrinibacteria bacterium]